MAFTYYQLHRRFEMEKIKTITYQMSKAETFALIEESIAKNIGDKVTIVSLEENPSDTSKYIINV